MMGSPENMVHHELTVPEGASGRLDGWLTKSLEGLSRDRVTGLIREGMVTVDGKPVKPSLAVAAGMKVEDHVPAPVPLALEPDPIPLTVIFEDDDLLVVVKPRGMLTHPLGSRLRGTLVNALLAHCQHLSGINGVMRPGIVHRLDQGTSGLMVVAKSDRAHAGLANAFKDRRMQKIYQAIVRGVPRIARGVIDIPMSRDPQHRNRMRIDLTRGRPARTEYQVLETFERLSLVELVLHTGRTHQIRVHMAHIGHPVAGDIAYGLGPVPGVVGLALHAMRLGFDHPVTGKHLQFEAPLPDDMAGLLERLR
jgi:23S rRNA pseudouridine1911/1915/1917 synthase